MLEVVAYLICDDCGGRLEAERGPSLDVDPGRVRVRLAGWQTRRKLVAGVTRRRDYCPDCRTARLRAKTVLYQRVETVDLGLTVAY